MIYVFTTTELKFMLSHPFWLQSLVFFPPCYHSNFQPLILAHECYLMTHWTSLIFPSIFRVFCFASLVGRIETGITTYCFAMFINTKLQITFMFQALVSYKFLWSSVWWLSLEFFLQSSTSAPSLFSLDFCLLRVQLPSISLP